LDGDQDIVRDILGRCRLAMEPALGSGMGEEDHQLIEELIERRLVPLVLMKVRKFIMLYNAETTSSMVICSPMTKSSVVF
jgi:hypothetical protein